MDTYQVIVNIAGRYNATRNTKLSITSNVFKFTYNCRYTDDNILLYKMYWKIYSC